MTHSRVDDYCDKEIIRCSKSRNPPPTQASSGRDAAEDAKPVLVTPHAPSDWLRGVDT